MEILDSKMFPRLMPQWQRFIENIKQRYTHSFPITKPSAQRSTLSRIILFAGMFLARRVDHVVAA